jgi:ribosomal-protein-alanine N-acetyltransferase
MIADAVEDLRPVDIGPLARLHARCFYDAWGVSMLRQVLAMPGTFGLIARWGGHGAMIGFALARVVADECELLSLGVAPDHRDRGVGRLLMEATMARAGRMGARHFFLEVAEDNEPGQRLYRRFGLAPVGRRPDYYENADGSRTAALTMRCRLDGPASGASTT